VRTLVRVIRGVRDGHTRSPTECETNGEFLLQPEVGGDWARKEDARASSDRRPFDKIHTLHGTRFSQTYCQVLPTLPSAATIILSTFQPTSWHPLFVSLRCTFSPSKFQIRIRQLFSETAASGRHMGSTRERASCIAKRASPCILAFQIRSRESALTNTRPRPQRRTRRRSHARTVRGTRIPLGARVCLQ